MERALSETGINAEIIWKSFQLNPSMKTEPGKTISQYLSEAKGWSITQAEQANAQVTQMAAQEGLVYNLSKSVVANSLRAHCLIQFAKERNLGDEAEEKLFYAYFTESKNIDNTDTLLTIAAGLGLKRDETLAAIESETMRKKVESDIMEAQQLGVRGVPFFVIDRKYGISGAQPLEVFVDTLKKAGN
jgi:predicted DsbA family dithiol-disulfide isomerase